MCCINEGEGNRRFTAEETIRQTISDLTKLRDRLKMYN
jgi:hypothetical protein